MIFLKFMSLFSTGDLLLEFDRNKNAENRISEKGLYYGTG